jgi:DNA-3-methyladenine glycosylase
MDVLPRGFYQRSAREVAIDLLGRRIIRTITNPTGNTSVSGTIVETEAYLGAVDLACHGSRGQTARNATMFGRPGLAYVYLIYGMYHCLNAVVGEVGDPSAVLIRAIAVDGVPDTTRPHPGSGPGRTSRVLSLTRHDDATDLCDATSSLVIVEGDRATIESRPQSEVRAGPRIGMGASAGEWAAMPLRFWLAGHRVVSGTRRAERDGLRLNE